MKTPASVTLSPSFTLLPALTAMLLFLPGCATEQKPPSSAGEPAATDTPAAVKEKPRTVVKPIERHTPEVATIPQQEKPVTSAPVTTVPGTIKSTRLVPEYTPAPATSGTSSPYSQRQPIAPRIPEQDLILAFQQKAEPQKVEEIRGAIAGMELELQRLRSLNDKEVDFVDRLSEKLMSEFEAGIKDTSGDATEKAHRFRNLLIQADSEISETLR
jgi:hypothetical protein